MNTRVMHKLSKVTPGVAYCGVGYIGTGHSAGMPVESQQLCDSWSQVNCPACKRLILDQLDAMPPGSRKDELVDELLGWGKGGTR